MFARPKEFKYPPHRGEDELKVSTKDDSVKDDLTSRYQHLQSRLSAMKVENEEVSYSYSVTSKFVFADFLV